MQKLVFAGAVVFAGTVQGISKFSRRAAAGWVLALASACSAGGGTGSEIPGVAAPGGGGGGSQQPGGPGQAPGFVPGGPDLGAGSVPPGVDEDFTGRPTCDTCTDFPTQPLFDDGVAADSAALFGQAGSGAPPCVIEPRDGMLIPANMLRPRVRFSGGGDVHKITVHAAREANDLVVYTRKNPWLIPPELWKGLSRNVFDEDITVTVESAKAGTPSSAPNSVRFRIAPVQAGGSMIYWAATSTLPGPAQNPLGFTTSLLGFSVGEEAVIATLKPGDVKETMLGDNGEVKKVEYNTPAGQARCVGCHTSTGDGKAVVVVDHWPWNEAVADVSSGSGGRPDYVTDFGAFQLQMPWLGVSTFSRGDWALGNRTLITSAGPRIATTPGAMLTPNQPERDVGYTAINNQTGQDLLLWFDLQAQGTVPPMVGQNINKAVGTALLGSQGTGWGVVARTGDTRGAVTPDWSHDGTTIAYTSTDSTKDGHVGDNANNVDIYTVPFNARAGGQATPVAGASQPGVAEYYPDFSADDRYIAFNRVQNGTGRIYYHQQGEIYIVRATGGEPIRLAANDPPMCSNERSPGVTNSWPKWSPTVRTGPKGTPHEGTRYYFLLFSSTRQSPFMLQGGGNVPASQLYLATVAELADGTVQTYPAMYLWNQGFLITNPDPSNPQYEPIQTSNLTPAFDEFLIPPRPPVVLR